jgi:hypothetical protein
MPELDQKRTAGKTNLIKRVFQLFSVDLQDPLMKVNHRGKQK